MPLPPPAPRKLLHTRTIVCEGYQRTDGQWDVDGRLDDVKAVDIDAWDGRGGIIPAGQPIHEMHLRLTVDSHMTITASTAAMDHFPWRLCPSIAPNFGKLAGLAIKPGFTRKVGEIVGGLNGCTHLGSLIGPLATTLMQTMVKARAARQKENDAKGIPRAVPRVLNTCHAWAATSPVVKRELPEFYKGN
jgi:hypothetical protein